MRKCSTCGALYEGDLCPTCIAGFAQKPSDPGAPPEELPLQPGQTFHGMEIMELVGRGGMGVVYKAKQPSLDRIVALKILPKKLALDPDFQNRFIREAKALGTLSHPNIVMVHDFGAEGGLFYFLMEFVDGVNLRQVMREKTLTPEKAIRVVPQLCDALEYAHAEGVVHRDIKPENILIDKKGRLKITDFGLAKLVGADQPAMLTQTNMVMGTPHYMAPEQVENPKSVDHRADIYSLGVVFYEMLTGELPIGRFEPPSKKVQIDVRLDDVVLKTLEKTPERRYQQASDVRNALSSVTTASTAESYQPTVVTPKPEKPEKPKNAAINVLIIACILAGLVSVVFLLMRPSREAAEMMAQANALFREEKYEAAQRLYERVLELDPTADQKASALRHIEECKSEVSAEPTDLTPFFFAPHERPLDRIIFDAKKMENVPRNPFPAKSGEERREFVKYLDGVGLQNVSPDDLRQAYVSIWYGCAFVLMDTPIAKRLESEFKVLDVASNKWSYRKGDLFAFIIAGRRESRDVHNALVMMAQKKLGLPVEKPDVPIENMKVTDNDLRTGMTLDVRKPAPIPGARESLHYTINREAGKPSVEYDAVVFEDADKAVNYEADRIRGTTTKKEILRSGRCVIVLSLISRDVHTFERVAYQARQWMGFPSRSFDTVTPHALELPAGFGIDSVQKDAEKVFEALDLGKELRKGIAKAWRATLKPHGAITLLEIEDYQKRYKVEEELDKRGIAEDRDSYMFLVEAPDIDGLETLENFMREKVGWDPKRRYVKIRHARLLQSDLPEGFKVEISSITASSLAGKITGPGASLSYTAKDSRDFRKVYADKADLPTKLGDIVLLKDTVVVHLSGTEAEWYALDLLEPILREKMKMGPMGVDDLELKRGDLPEGARFTDRTDIGYAANPIRGKQAAKRDIADASGIVDAWIGYLEPKDTEVLVLQLADEAAATSHVEHLRKVHEKAVALSVLSKGVFVVMVRQIHGTDGSFFNALSTMMRGRLRAPKPK